MELNTLTVQQLSGLLEKKEVSSLEITQDYLNRIKKMDNDLQAFVTITETEALDQARLVDEKRMRGEELSSLAGIPMAAQDNICTGGVKTTCASKMLNNYIPPTDATAIVRLKKAGSILIGKTNMDEFGMGSSTENSAFFTTKNPYNYTSVPGGAGGGSAAAVAAGETTFALGSDMGGDIRQPAAFCGVIGFKPTYGYVPRTGLISTASSLDQMGAFSRDMTDMALILNTICGHDAYDSTSALVAVPDFQKSLINDVKGLKIGLPKEYFAAGVEPKVAAKFQEAIKKLEELGASCIEISLPHTEYAVTAHYIISCAEASSNLARYDGVRYGQRVDGEDVLSMFMKTRSQGFGAEVKRRILTGTHVLSTGKYDEYYTEALKVRTLNKEDFAQAFEKVDCLLTPATLTTAYRSGEMAGDPLAMYRSDVCAIPASLAGLPAMSLPFGLVDQMPVGLQLIGSHFNDKTLLRVGYALEQNTDQTRLKPNLIRG
ncbi:glutamyl-tRNA(Gln) and/or aspartyl-tRNA(Asn) amidotransferase, A subunit [Desulfitobacterium dichloroeliminans LMG P-21439]|uniref:Glutamyl-tRNA(Gln) amidotransferase subunit A n=1 Tax=Desulfitobacterium dichloroeliminans (strain LMG P-21439 / DCA1) TaxID=871963 RepID=L0F547_DESDL|nr:Asp-tRNA(Asn)/Glu-tRNA(Gln) amidotransferase subunit GatA [Desulfitobacterium dichloroeliminans]AGA68038.1 glutamyl-tRNA(Gln) and/or aspartyl-tRNA(Asn) amidotransferase, A subunit [Desulfitobacterium dichloroeliminans LMG P-21439]